MTKKSAITIFTLIILGCAASGLSLLYSQNVPAYGFDGFTRYPLAGTMSVRGWPHFVVLDDSKFYFNAYLINSIIWTIIFLIVFLIGKSLVYIIINYPISVDKQYWSKKYEKAKQNRNNSDSVLIEVAAQHPLNDDGTPGTEFQNRLDWALKLRKQLEQTGKTVFFYIPGSLHVHEGKTDICSLSDSGKTYLISKGIDEKKIFAEDVNHKYTKDGVYNSADECYVASMLYKKHNFGRLYCVCSSGQLLRKKLVYVSLGVLPLFYSADVDESFHNDIYEIFHSIPEVLRRESSGARKTREERKPNPEQKS